MTEKDGLVNRALAKANGANIHDLRVLCGYYRNAVTYPEDYINKHWSKERRQQRLKDIARYEEVLEHFAATGKFPKKE